MIRKNVIQVRAFKDGDEFGSKNVSMGINSILSGGGQATNFDEDDDLENILKQENNNNVLTIGTTTSRFIKSKSRRI